MKDKIRHWLTEVGMFTAKPAAFLIVIAYTIGWMIFHPETFEWHAVAVLATWMMTLFIQRAAHRDMQAIHAKIDELLRINPDARTILERLDEEEPEVIVKQRLPEQE